MAYASQEARQDLLASIAEAIDEVGRAMAALGDAYDQLDEHTADVLEEQMFRPAQAAYARAQRTYSGFAERHGLEGRAVRAASAGRVGGGGERGVGGGGGDPHGAAGLDDAGRGRRRRAARRPRRRARAARRA